MLYKSSFVLRQLLTSISILTTLTCSLPVNATPLLPSLANASVAATDATNLFNPSSFGQWYLNTDNGHIYAQYSNYPWEDKGVSGRIVSQSGGPDVWAWNFSSLNITANLRIYGSRPAVILSGGNISINVPVVVEAGGQAGGTGGKNTDANSIQNPSDNGTAGAGTNGGLGGQGGGHIVSPYPPNPWGWAYAFSGGGGGGGFYRAGQNAPTDAPVMPYVYNGTTYVMAPPAVQYARGNGGPACTNFFVLRGGGGGGGGGSGSGWGGGGDPFSPGGNGGAGGGAILFATPGSLSIGNNGSVSVDGKKPAYIGASNTEGSGGGGAGGYAAFSTGGVFTNNGAITAKGAYGSYSNGLLHPPGTSSMGGSGSGGFVAIKAGTMAGNGTINVAGGDGSGSTSGRQWVVKPANLPSIMLLLLNN